MPALGVIGTGKRVGKTAVSGWLARRLDERLRADGGVLVVAMGRGGPPEPELVAGGDGLGPAELLAASRAGLHAASDCYEDAVLAGVTTVGCRRCGGGLAGAPFDDNVRAALPLVEASGAALAVFEGSGSVVPPVACDAALCVAGAAQPPEYVTGYLGTYRLLLSDVLVLTQCEPPFADAGRCARSRRPRAPWSPASRSCRWCSGRGRRSRSAAAGWPSSRPRRRAPRRGSPGARRGARRRGRARLRPTWPTGRGWRRRWSAPRARPTCSSPRSRRRRSTSSPRAPPRPGASSCSATTSPWPWRATSAPPSTGSRARPALRGALVGARRSRRQTRPRRPRWGVIEHGR